MMYTLLKLLTAAALIHAKDNHSPRIIGGYDISIEEAPYTVKIENGKGYCGGSILSEKFVVTAAHCINFKGQIYVRAGTSDFTGSGQLIKSKKAIRHPDFKWLTIGAYNDYGLIVLKKPLVFNSKVQPISMAKDSLPVGTMMLATGWGYYKKDNAENSSVLRAVLVPTVADDVCRTLFNGEQHDSILCAGYFDQDMSVYIGDSGGPLVFNKTLYGITSFGDCPKLPNYPAGFARISYGYNWLMKTMKENK